MQRIGILTYHAGYNFGASLQAFALQRCIMQFQEDCEIIRFEPMALVNQRALFPLPPRNIRDVIKDFSRIPYYGQVMKRKELFDCFTTETLKTSPLYRTEKEVELHATDYDCIVCGSDQIWNLDPNMSDYGSLVYFLNFPKLQRRVSYAGSFGKWVKQADTRQDEFMPWLEKFDAISVREQSGDEYLKDKGINCQTVLDPTLLLPRSEYETIACMPDVTGDYVLIISWTCERKLIEAAKKTAKKLKCQLLHINPPPKGMLRGLHRKLDVGPREFLGLIQNARLIITDSFHGTVFSTIFGKPFFSVYTDTPDARIQSTLRSLGMEDRMVKPNMIDGLAGQAIDYERNRTLLEKERVSSITFLKRAIGQNAS